MKSKTISWRDQVAKAKIPMVLKKVFYSASERTHVKSSPGSYAGSYYMVGYILALFATEKDNVKLLQQLLRMSDKIDQRRWFSTNYNEVYVLVPPRRRDIFIRGFIRIASQLI